MLSLDRTLLQTGEYQGDTVERHRLYGERVEQLDVVVFCRGRQEINHISSRVTVWPTNSSWPLTYFYQAYRLGKELHQKNRYDLIVCQDFTALAGYFLKKSIARPLLINFHGDYLENQAWLKESPVNYLWLWLFKYLAVKADGLRVTSQGLKSKFERLKIESEKIRVINTPVNTKFFSTSDHVKLNALKNKYHSQKIILFVGRLVKLKNIPLLFKVLKELKLSFPVKLLIIGRGEEEENLKKLVSQFALEKEVEFLGVQPMTELVNYYFLADVLVMPSQHESFGKVLVEAGLAAKPVIVTPTTGSADIVKDRETGFIIDFNDEQSLLGKCQLLFADEKLAVKMGQAAQTYLQDKFDQQKTIDMIINFWQTLVDNSKQ